MRLDTLTILGVGLLGGSVGLAASARRVANRVVGLGRSAVRLHDAITVGAVTEITTDPTAAVRDADLIVVCTPVDRIAEDVLALAKFAKPGAIITDVGSTKGNVARGVGGGLPEGVHFVGSHPIAGSEKTGVEFAKVNLFIDRTTVVTPTTATPAHVTNYVAEFWRALGSKVVVASPDDHDRLLAESSHLPHLLASALANTLSGEAAPFAATGFRDTTRIAAGDPGLWEAIFRANRPAVLVAADRFDAQLQAFRKLLAADDGPGLNHWLSEGKRVRDALGS